MASMLKLACVVLAFMVVVAPYEAEGAISCGMVVSKVSPCIGYLKGAALPPICCAGLKFLLGAAHTTPDRQACWGRLTKSEPLCAIRNLHEQ
ncbi:hypothetical protein MKX03_003393 [Papaver bracteatum]|nr:hypothetical protein MKX03_003393 [Papaver bracteatum]